MQAQTAFLFIMCVCSMYATISFYGYIHILAYLTFPCLASSIIIVSSVIYPGFYELTNEVVKFRKSWQDNVLLKPHVTKDTLNTSSLITENAFLKFLASTPDVAVEMGTFYKFVKTTSTTFNFFVVNYTINTLLAFKVY